MAGASSLIASVGFALSRSGARIVPFGAASAVARPIGGSIGLLWESKRETAERNFARVLGLPVDHPRVKATARECFRQWGRYVVETIAVQSWGTEEVAERLEVDGDKHFDEALAHGRGVIFVSGHMGATEVGAAMAVLRGYKIATPVEDAIPGWLFEYLQVTRQSMGITVLPAARSGVTLLRTLRRGGMAAFVIDAGIDRGGAATVDFFGKPALFPDGPARLARLSGAPLVFGTCVRLPRGRYRAYVHPPLLANRDGDPAEDAQRVTQELAAMFEALIRRHPTQWYAFREMWRG